MQGIADATRATLADDAKFQRYAATVRGAGADQAAIEDLRKRTKDYLGNVDAYLTRNAPLHPWGYGRVDSFNVLSNEVLAKTLHLDGTLPGRPNNLKQPDSPNNIPSLWETGDIEWQGANGSVNNAIARMTLEVLGVFADFLPANDRPGGFRSTVQLAALHEMDLQIAGGKGAAEARNKLLPPKWPADVFGPIGADAAEGEKIFEAQCASCHWQPGKYQMTKVGEYPYVSPDGDPTHNPYRKPFIKIVTVPLAEIGTDPGIVRNFLTRTAHAGPELMKVDAIKAALKGAEEVPAIALTRVLVGGFLLKNLDALGLSPLQKVAYTNFHPALKPEEMPDIKVYKARPLSGIWATAPYLHNGSVPNLDELLKEPAERTPRFTLGTFAYDPELVGFAPSSGPDAFGFDATLPGNLNTGHAYPPHDAQEKLKASNPNWRHALISYLKTL
jgi:hypothetical protein